MAGAQHGMCELMARHGSGTAWARHGHGMLYVNRPSTYLGLQKAILAAAKEENTDKIQRAVKCRTLIGNQIPVFHIQSVTTVTYYTVIYNMWTVPPTIQQTVAVSHLTTGMETVCRKLVQNT